MAKTFKQIMLYSYSFHYRTPRVYFSLLEKFKFVLKKLIKIYTIYKKNAKYGNIKFTEYHDSSKSF